MDSNTQSELLLSVASKFIAERDDAYYRINAILSDVYNYEVDQQKELKNQFDMLAQAKLGIEQVQMLYAQRFKMSEESGTKSDPISSSAATAETDSTNT